MILVDSSVWIDYFNGTQTWQADALDDLLDRDVIAVGDLILAEVLQGFRSPKDYETAKRLLCDLHYVPLGGKDVALECRRELPHPAGKGRDGPQNRGCFHRNRLHQERLDAASQ